uniref:Uncharacterized protein n=1 Tax=Angiostrongylus cantonensis TaxID=6313 RepID=A0A0K0D608_ANGCA
MKAIFLICISVAVALYNAAQYAPQKYPVPYGAAYGKYEPYHKPYYYPKWYNQKYSSSSSRGYYDCWRKDDSEESHERESKRCSHCQPIEILRDGFKRPASIRHNTLSNGCSQAIISCPKSASFAITSVSRNGPRNTTLALGTGNGVVAECGHDRKWHTSSLDTEDVTVDTVDCIKLPLRREQVPARRVANIDPDGDEEDGSGDADGAFLNNTHTV